MQAPIRQRAAVRRLTGRRTNKAVRGGKPAQRIICPVPACDFSHFKSDVGLALLQPGAREIPMHSDNHMQAFTVFGGAYVTEGHGSPSCLPVVQGNRRSAAKMAVVTGLLLFGVTAAT